MNAKENSGFRCNVCDAIFAVVIIIALMQITIPASIAGMWVVIAGGLAFVYLMIRAFAHDVATQPRGQTLVPRVRDTSSVDRVIIENKSGRRHVISGWKDQTFRSACLEAWVFTSVKKKSDWTIIDDKGNDISDSPMSIYEGIARIGLLGPMCEQLVGDEATDYYTDDDRKNNDLERGVKFYD